MSSSCSSISSITWAYGVTTTPSRINSLLPKTLSSLALAGFDTPRIFIDGAVPNYFDRLGFEIVHRYPIIGPYGNWFLAIVELYLREPTAQRYAIFQDDLITYKNLRQYLDQCEYPDGETVSDGSVPPRKRDKCYWNLYTHDANYQMCRYRADGNNELKGWYHSDQLGKGAVGLVFNRACVMELLSSKHMIHRVQNRVRGWKWIDGAVIEALSQLGWKEFVHNPSLVQHTGLESSAGNLNDQSSPNFLGEDFDAMKLITPLEKR